MSNEDRPEADHLEDVDDGCGCAELWEHTSEQREEAEAKTTGE